MECSLADCWRQALFNNDSLCQLPFHAYPLVFAALKGISGVRGALQCLRSLV